MLHRGAWWLPGKPYRTHSLHTAHNPPQHWVAVKKALLDLGVLVCLFFSLAALFSSGDKSVMMPLLFDSVAEEAARGPAWPWKCRASFSGDSKSTGELNAHTRHYLLFIKTDRVVYNKLVCLSPWTTGWSQTTCPSNQERRFRRVSSPTGSSSTDGDGRTQKSFLLEPLNFIKLSVGTRASTHDQGGSSWSAFLSGLSGDPSQLDLRGNCLYPQFLGVCKWRQTTRKTIFLSALLMSRLYEQRWVWTLPSSHARGTSQNKLRLNLAKENQKVLSWVSESLVMPVLQEAAEWMMGESGTRLSRLHWDRGGKTVPHPVRAGQGLDWAAGSAHLPVPQSPTAPSSSSHLSRGHLVPLKYLGPRYSQFHWFLRYLMPPSLRIFILLQRATFYASTWL